MTMHKWDVFTGGTFTALGRRDRPPTVWVHTKALIWCSRSQELWAHKADTGASFVRAEWESCRGSGVGVWEKGTDAV